MLCQERFFSLPAFALPALRREAEWEKDCRALQPHPKRRFHHLAWRGEWEWWLVVVSAAPKRGLADRNRQTGAAHHVTSSFPEGTESAGGWSHKIHQQEAASAPT